MSEPVTQLLSDPNYGVAVLALGLLAVYVEFCRPGNVFPAALGGVLILLSSYALTRRPLAPAGAGWCLAALLCASSAVRTSYPLLWSLLAAVAFTVGLRRLWSDPPLLNVLWGGALSFAMTGVTVRLLRLARRARRSKRTVSQSLSRQPL